MAEAQASVLVIPGSLMDLLESTIYWTKRLRNPPKVETAARLRQC